VTTLSVSRRPSLWLGRLLSIVRATASVLRHPLSRIVARRILTTVPLLFVVTSLTFILESLTPGDPVQAILGLDAPRAQYPILRHQLGLDRPVYSQYWEWVAHAVRGDFGTSIFSGQSVSELINQRLPVTLSLIVASLVVSVLVGVSFGVISAARGGFVGRIVDIGSVLGFAMPSFWLGALLISLFAVKLGWLPPTGYVSLGDSPTAWAESLVLPVLALATGGIAGVAKQTREAMLDVLGSEYIRLARAHGVRPLSLLLRHGLKNAAPRITTIVGLQAVGLIGGTVVVESVFALPGLGSLALNAATQHDLPIIEGMVFYFTIIVVAINLLTDLTAMWLNPKSRGSRG
jgi:peptide/nickel transport system permease protein